METRLYARHCFSAGLFLVNVVNSKKKGYSQSTRCYELPSCFVVSDFPRKIIEEERRSHPRREPLRSVPRIRPQERVCLLSSKLSAVSDSALGKRFLKMFGCTCRNCHNNNINRTNSQDYASTSRQSRWCLVLMSMTFIQEDYSKRLSYSSHFTYVEMTPHCFESSLLLLFWHAIASNDDVKQRKESVLAELSRSSVFTRFWTGHGIVAAVIADLHTHTQDRKRQS